MLPPGGVCKRKILLVVPMVGIEKELPSALLATESEKREISVYAILGRA
jgi:hypothetical protein